MDESTRKSLEGISGVAKIAETLKINSAAQSVMDKIAQAVPKIPSFNIPKAHNPMFAAVPYRPPTQEEINKYQSSSVFMQALADEALQWKSNLPENYRPAIIALLYGGIQIHVHSLSKVSFHGICIEGTLNGAPCSLLAHQSTIQILCHAEEVTGKETSTSIGFIWDDNNIEV